MANATARTALSGVQPKAVHAGVNAVKFSYVASASHSGTDVITLGKLPRGAIVDEVILLDTLPAGAASLPSVLNIELGDAGLVDRYLSVSLNTVVLTRATGGVGYLVSVSDAADVLYQTVRATCGATHVQSASQGFEILVMYHMDQTKISG